jgi:rhodanese-related sulfurtransferase
MRSSDKRGFGPLLRQASRQAAVMVLIALVPAVLTGWLHPRRPHLPDAEASAREITVGDAVALGRVRPVVWVDARDAAAFGAGNIPGAVRLTDDAWEQLLPGFVGSWRPGQSVVVYCDSRRCDASRSVAARLAREFAINDVYVLTGGWEAWQQRQK